MVKTAKGNYTFRIDDRTYIIRVQRGHESTPRVEGNVTIYRKTWKAQTTWITAGGGRTRKGESRAVARRRLRGAL